MIADWISVVWGVGNVLADAGDPASVDRAIKAYKRAIQLNDTFETAYSNLGRAYKIAERMDEAIAIGELSVKLSPDSPHAHTHLGTFPLPWRLGVWSLRGDCALLTWLLHLQRLCRLCVL